MSKNIFVFAEQRDGKLQKVSLELIGKARELITAPDQKVAAVLIGYDIREAASNLIAFGADEVIIAENPAFAEYMTEPYAKAMSEIISQRRPEIVLYGATSIGRDLAPRVSARILRGLRRTAQSLRLMKKPVCCS